MITVFLIYYNIIRQNKSKINWLDLDNSEGVNTALTLLIVDVIIILGVLRYAA